MRMLGALLMILAVGTLAHVPEADAYTIAVDCQVNGVPPPHLPYQNALCTYTWSPGGDDVRHRWGRMSTSLQYWDVNPVDDVHHIDGNHFNLWSTTPPITSWIACANIAGTFRLIMNGYLYRYVFGGVNGPGYYSQVDTKSDHAFTYVSPPLRTCP